MHLRVRCQRLENAVNARRVRDARVDRCVSGSATLCVSAPLQFGCAIAPASFIFLLTERLDEVRVCAPVLLQ